MKEQVREYKTRAGNTQLKPSIELLHELDEDNEGFCLACGETQITEPDTTKEVCECCGAAKVYGASELVLMGLYF